MKVSIIGLGWYGLPLALKLSTRHDVRGTKSQLQSVSNWSHPSVAAFHLNLSNNFSNICRSDIFDIDLILVNVPPPKNITSPVEVYLSWMKRIAACIKQFDVKHLIFVSSTGVFADGQGWVDESSEPVPDRPAGKSLLAAERFFCQSSKGRVSIIRPGGLIGQGRHPARYLSGRSGIPGANHPVNLVHRNDLILLSEWLIEKDHSGGIFHAVALQHPKKSEYYTDACKRLHLEPGAYNVEDTSKGKVVLSEKTRISTGLKFEYDDPYKMI